MAKESRDIMFYDIPAKWNDEKIVDVFQKVMGKVNKLTVKKQYKYITVKVNINKPFQIKRKTI